MTDQNLAAKLESMIDAHGLRTVLQLISAICEEKAEHVQTNWQDDALAGEWHNAGVAIERCADNASVYRVGNRA